MFLVLKCYFCLSDARVYYLVKAAVIDHMCAINLDREIIPEKMPGRKIVLQAELDVAERLIGIRAHHISLPIYKVHKYIPPPGIADGYSGLRNWYRNGIEANGSLSILHTSDMQRSLLKAPADALDYLATEDEEERAKNEGWREPGNEAIYIAQWIFPANAINRAVIAQNFNYEIIIISVTKHQREFDRVYYFVNQKEHTITYSHHFRGKTIRSKS